jgi:EAL domain-containing protein (putative c-di-GMP-specific phosphodiesterase class I)
VTGLGKSLGVTTTAEGVETKEELDFVRQEGCSEAQGYLFSKPRHPREILTLLGRKPVAAKAVA